MRRCAFADHLGGERLHLAASNPVDRGFAKPRQQPEAENAPVVGQGGGLAADLLEFAEHQLGGSGEGHLVAGFERAIAEHFVAALPLPPAWSKPWSPPRGRFSPIRRLSRRVPAYPRPYHS